MEAGAAPQREVELRLLPKRTFDNSCLGTVVKPQCPGGNGGCQKQATLDQLPKLIVDMSLKKTRQSMKVAVGIDVSNDGYQCFRVDEILKRFVV